MRFGYRGLGRILDGDRTTQALHAEVVCEIDKGFTFRPQVGVDRVGPRDVGREQPVLNQISIPSGWAADAVDVIADEDAQDNFRRIVGKGFLLQEMEVLGAA